MEDKKGCCMGEGCMWMKHHPYRRIFGFVLAVIVAIFFVNVCSDGRDRDVQKDTIVVNGKGELTVKPDIANISFSVMEENLDVSKASDAVNTKIAKIVDALKADGVAETDIKTTGYNINPRYDYITTQAFPSYGGRQVLAGYDVTQSVQVKIRDLTKAGKIVTDLGTLNVTNISGLTFTNDKYDDLVKQARDQAIVQARSEAKKLAKSLGVRLVKIIGYSEGNYPVYYDSAVYGMGVSATKAAAPAVLPAGENKITSNVSITYEIR